MASSSTFPPLSIPNISHLVYVKLTDTNYLIWESQVKPFLLGQNLWRFVDGSFPCPPTTLAPTTSSDPSAASQDSQPNSDYFSWFQTDQSLINILRATLSETILPQVVGLSTSKDIWDCLQQNFSQQSLANGAQLKFHLFSITKGTKSISDYLAHAKNLADQLTIINDPVSNSDVVTFVLRGLGPEYGMLVTAILHFPPLPSFSDLRARLLSFEAQQELAVQMTPNAQPSAFLSARNPSGPRTPRTRVQPTRFPAVASAQGYGPVRPPLNPAPSQGLLGPPPPLPQCWNCRQYGHLAARCPHPRAFAGMHIASSTDPNWYFDSGATNHMTHDARSASTSIPQSSSDQVVIGNGTSLPITHSGPM